MGAYISAAGWGRLHGLHNGAPEQCTSRVRRAPLALNRVLRHPPGEGDIRSFCNEDAIYKPGNAAPRSKPSPKPSEINENTTATTQNKLTPHQCQHCTQPLRNILDSTTTPPPLSVTSGRISQPCQTGLEGGVALDPPSGETPRCPLFGLPCFSVCGT